MSDDSYSSLSNGARFQYRTAPNLTTVATPNGTAFQFNNGTEFETDRVEDVVFGTIMVLYSAFTVVPYALCLYVFATDKEIKSRPCYRIIFSIGVADVLQSLCNGIVGGTFSILHSTGFRQLNKRLGSVLESSWMAYSILVNLLAFNRCVQVCWPHKAAAIFAKKNTSILISLCWIYGGIWLIVYNTPWVTVSYSTSFYIWGYEMDGGSIICNFVEMGLDLFQLFCTTVWYTCVLVRLRFKAHQMVNSSDINKQELSILMQSFCVCLLYFATCFGFFVVPVISSNRYATFVSDLIWLINCSFNPVIYLSFNKRLRRKVGDLIRCNRSVTVAPAEMSARREPHGRVELTTVHALSIRQFENNRKRQRQAITSALDAARIN